MTNQSVVQFPVSEQAEPAPVVGEAFARSLWDEQLSRSAAMAAIARILNGIECQRDGLPLVDLKDRDFKDFIRISARAKAIVRSVGEDVHDQAIDDMARRISEGFPEDGHRSFDDETPAVQNYYLRLAQSVENIYWASLEGRQS